MRRGLISSGATSCRHARPRKPLHADRRDGLLALGQHAATTPRLKNQSSSTAAPGGRPRRATRWPSPTLGSRGAHPTAQRKAPRAEHAASGAGRHTGPAGPGPQPPVATLLHQSASSRGRLPTSCWGTHHMLSCCARVAMRVLMLGASQQAANKKSGQAIASAIQPHRAFHPSIHQLRQQRVQSCLSLHTRNAATTSSPQPCMAPSDGAPCRRPQPPAAVAAWWQVMVQPWPQVRAAQHGTRRTGTRTGSVGSLAGGAVPPRRPLTYRKCRKLRKVNECGTFLLFCALHVEPYIVRAGRRCSRLKS